MMGMTLTVRVIGTEVSTESKDAQHRKVIRVDNHSFKVRAHTFHRQCRLCLLTAVGGIGRGVSWLGLA